MNLQWAKEEKDCGSVGLLPQTLKQGRGPRPCTSCPAAHLSFKTWPRDGGCCPRREAEAVPQRGPQAVVEPPAAVPLLKTRWRRPCNAKQCFGDGLGLVSRAFPKTTAASSSSRSPQSRSPKVGACCKSNCLEQTGSRRLLPLSPAPLCTTGAQRRLGRQREGGVASSL